MPVYTVQEGDCITSIADQAGLTWQKVWDHPENAGLRQQRTDPNVLYPGDSVFVPDLEIRKESRPTDQRHRFKKLGSTAKLKLRLLVEDKPRAGEPYKLVIDGVTKSGTTDGNGFINQSLPPGATSGTLYVGTGVQDVYQLSFGALDPIDTPEGVTKRLLNLGYGTDDLAEAISAFQQKQGLTVTGQVDAATRAKLQSEHGQ